MSKVWVVPEEQKYCSSSSRSRSLAKKVTRSTTPETTFMYKFGLTNKHMRQNHKRAVCLCLYKQPEELCKNYGFEIKLKDEFSVIIGIIKIHYQETFCIWLTGYLL